MGGALRERGAALFLQPLAVSYEPYDYHVMLYFKGHPAYEAVEAMIQEHGREIPYIRVIMTRHDQSQVEYINDSPTVERIKAKNGGRECYYAPIQYTHLQIKEQHHFLLTYAAQNGDAVVFDFRSAGKARSWFAGLVDPGEHARDSSLPIMYREKSTLADPGCKITINGIAYKIPVKIWVPLFFKGLQGYYSESFVMGAIRRSGQRLVQISSPAKLAVGEQWVYGAVDRLLSYEIIERTGDRVVLQNDNETIFARVSSEGFGIEKLLYADPGGLPYPAITFSFDPMLPTPLYNGTHQEEIHFSMTIKDSALVKGTVGIQRQDGFVRYLLEANQPKWAARRVVCIAAKEKDPQIVLETRII